MNDDAIPTADDHLRTLHAQHGDYLAEITVDTLGDTSLNVNVALTKLPSEEPLGIISFNGPTLRQALRDAVRYLEEQTPA